MEEVSAKKRNEVVFVSGIFNVLHPGHFRFLKFAKDQGARLVVGVLSDAIAPEATVDEAERLANVKALAFTDEVVLLSQPPQEYIKSLRPDIVVKGWEHHDKNLPEKEIIKEYGGRLIFSSGDIKLSGFTVANIENSHTALHTIAKPTGFMKRHNFSGKDSLAMLERFQSLNVCVLGDIIVDQYLNCQPVGMSQEDPTIVVRPAQSKFYLGGAGIVACHARSLGADVHFISVCGDDEAGEYSKNQFDEMGVQHHIFQDQSRPTTQKKRYRASGKTLLRVNDYADHPISENIRAQILEQLKKLAYGIDVIIFSDFSYGALPQDLVDEITSWAQDKDIVITADSQSSSQIGDISRFQNLWLVTPTEHEARLALNNYTDGLVQLGDKMQEKTGAKNVVITLAEEGLFIKKAQNDQGEIVNDRLPALQSSVQDVSGAGDAFLVTASMALAAGADIWQSAYLGSLASAIQVSRVGNIPLQNAELAEALNS